MQNPNIYTYLQKKTKKIKFDLKITCDRMIILQKRIKKSCE